MNTTINKIKLMNLCKKISASTGVHINLIIRHYFFERLIERISKSNQKEQFIFKGGLIISNYVGLTRRHTEDIDIDTKHFHFTKEILVERLNEIFDVQLDDRVKFTITKVENILETSDYKGYSITIKCSFDNLVAYVPIDFATGSPITPGAIPYDYQSLFFAEDKYNIFAYNIESILAEKLQSICSKIDSTYRIKDFFDVYYLYNIYKSNIDLNILKEACVNSFNYRKTEFNAERFITQLEQEKTSDTKLVLWEAFDKTKEHSFEEIVDFICHLIRIIDK